MDILNKEFMHKYRRLTKADYIEQQKVIEERKKCFVCVCGSSLQNRYMLFKHVNSVKHQAYLKNN
jgi:hypothetical protein